MAKEYFSDKLMSGNRKGFGHYSEASFLTVSECEEIIGLHKSLNLVKAAESWGDKNVNSRKNDLYWLFYSPESPWLFERVREKIIEVNSHNYQFLLNGVIRAFQLTHYLPGHGYDWHQDIGPNEASYRKLTVMIQLSDENDYEGGDLQFFYDGVQTVPTLRQQGSITIFPSWTLHRVKRLRTGVRWSLVNWLEGPRFR